MNWATLRSHFPVRANLGQWLRWEAALEEIRAYYRVPDEFRRLALTTFGEGVARIIESSPSLRLLQPQQRPENGDVEDEELAQTTIFSFSISHNHGVLSLDDCRKIYRALGSANGRDCPEIAAKVCLVGQPVALGGFERHPVAALRVCAGARLVTETWSSDQDTARGNLQRELDRVGAIAAKIEWLVAHMNDLNLGEPCHEA